MKAYRVKAKVYNARLLNAIEREYPGLSLMEVQRRMGVYGLHALVAMKNWPGSKTRGHGGWTNLAWKIADALRDDPAYLFDRELYGRTPVTITFEADRQALVAAGVLSLPPAPDEIVEVLEREQVVQQALERLSARQRRVLAMRFGFSGEEPMTSRQTADVLGVSRSRVHQIEAVALRKLRSSSVVAVLRSVV